MKFYALVWDKRSFADGEPRNYAAPGKFCIMHDLGFPLERAYEKYEKIRSEHSDSFIVDMIVILRRREGSQSIGEN